MNRLFEGLSVIEHKPYLQSLDTLFSQTKYTTILIGYHVLTVSSGV